MNRETYLAGLLVILRDGLAPVIDDLLAGDALQVQLGELASSLEHVAEELRTVHVVGTQESSEFRVVGVHKGIDDNGLDTWEITLDDSSGNTVELLYVAASEEEAQRVLTFFTS